MTSLKYAKTLKHIEKVISSNPELVAAYKQAEKDLEKEQQKKTTKFLQL